MRSWNLYSWQWIIAWATLMDGAWLRWALYEKIVLLHRVVNSPGLKRRRRRIVAGCWSPRRHQRPERQVRDSQAITDRSARSEDSASQVHLHDEKSHWGDDWCYLSSLEVFEELSPWSIIWWVDVLSSRGQSSDRDVPKRKLWRYPELSSWSEGNLHRKLVTWNFYQCSGGCWWSAKISLARKEHRVFTLLKVWTKTVAKHWASVWYDIQLMLFSWQMIQLF